MLQLKYFIVNLFIFSIVAILKLEFEVLILVGFPGLPTLH